MAVNAQFVGRTYPPTAPYVVSAAKIAEFAQAVQAVDPVHTDAQVARERGYADVVAPPTFAVLVAQQADRQLIEDPEAGIDFSRVVHGEQTFEHHAPLVAGDAVVVTTSVDAVREVAGNAMVTTRSEVTTVDGAPRCTATSMLVIRGED